MNRFDVLIAKVDEYQSLAAENYNRIRRLAEDMRAGLCDFLGARDGVCVQLVPPAGPFEPRAYGDQAFSVAPRGFRPLGPIAFGLAIRVSRSGADWLRLAVECRKTGEDFVVQIEGGEAYTFRLPISAEDAQPFFEYVYDHVLRWFSEQVMSYRDGAYGARDIGFDFSREPATA